MWFSSSSSSSSSRSTTLAVLFLLATSLLIRQIECLIEQEELDLLSQPKHQQELVIYNTQDESVNNADSTIQRRDQTTTTPNKTPPGGDPNLTYYNVFFNYTFQLLLVNKDPDTRPNAMEIALETIENAIVTGIKTNLRKNEYEKRVIIRIATSELVADKENCKLTAAAQEKDIDYQACSLAKTSFKTKVDSKLDEQYLDHVMYLDIQKLVHEFNTNYTGKLKVIYGGPISVSTMIIMELDPSNSAMNQAEIFIFEDALFKTYSGLFAKPTTNPDGFVLESIKILVQESSYSSLRRLRQRHFLGSDIRSLQAEEPKDRDDDDDDSIGDDGDGGEDDPAGGVRVQIYVRATCLHGFAKDDTAATDGGDVKSNEEEQQLFTCTDKSLSDYTHQELAFNNALFLEKLKFQATQGKGTDYFDNVNHIKVLDKDHAITDGYADDIDSLELESNVPYNKTVTIDEVEYPQWIWVLVGLAIGILACGLCMAMIIITNRYQKDEERRSNNRHNRRQVADAAAQEKIDNRGGGDKRQQLTRKDQDSYMTPRIDNRRRGSGGTEINQRRGSGGTEITAQASGSGVTSAATAGGTAVTDAEHQNRRNSNQSNSNTNASEEDVMYDFEQHASAHEDDDFDEDFSCSYDEAIACGAAAAHAAENPDVMAHSFGDLDTIVTNESDLRNGLIAPPSPHARSSPYSRSGGQQQQQQHQHQQRNPPPPPGSSNTSVSVRPMSEDPDVYFD